MSNEASDSSSIDIDNEEPSCSKTSCAKSNKSSKVKNAATTTTTTTAGKKQKKARQKIVMRIEFEDSNGEEDEQNQASTSDSTSDEELNEDKPTCSTRVLRRQQKRCRSDSNNVSSSSANTNIAGSSTSSTKLRPNRRRIIRVIDESTSSEDSSSDGSEILRRTLNRTRNSRNPIDSEEDERQGDGIKNTNNVKSDGEQDGGGFTSDSSSNDSLEKCPICLLSYRQQEIGTPASCEHIFCANCIEAWSRNVQTCPIDRLEFDRIVVRATYENRAYVREILVDPGKASTELILDDEEGGNDENDVTFCEICNSSEREDVMLLCDSCNEGYHIYCLSPPLTEIPEGSWYCDNCFDSSVDADDDGIDEDLDILYQDIRDMGIPESQLRVTEVQQPRILRTRQNERIRAAIMRRTRANARAQEEMTTTVTTVSTSSNNGTQPRRSRTTTTTTTTTTRRTNNSVNRTGKTRKRRRRRRVKRTYVVEYDINNFDEKFAIKTSKKVIRRRKRRTRRTNRGVRSSRTSSNKERLTASKRLAEQMGVKKDANFRNDMHSGSGFTLFGNRNDLEYFSDSDVDEGQTNANNFRDHFGSGGPVQTAVRLANYGNGDRLRSKLLLGKSAPRRIANIPQPPTSADLLSNLMDMQDRWHNATRKMSDVRINPDGTLKFSDSKNGTHSGEKQDQERNRLDIQSQPNTMEPTNDKRTDIVSNEPNSNTSSQVREQNSNPQEIMQAPMYPRGGGNPNFNNSGGGSYNKNNYNNNNSGNYRNSSGTSGNSNARNSTGGNNMNNLSTMVGRGNFNFSSPNYNPNSNPNQNSNASPLNFSPFTIRFNNQRNQQNQRNNNQRNSLPFMGRNDNNQPSQMEQTPPNAHFNQGPPQSMLTRPPMNKMQMDNLFSGIPPPITSSAVQPPSQPLFSGLPPPTNPDMLTAVAPVSVPAVQPLLSVPPPPAPPPGVQIPWSNSLFQLNTNYGGNDDDDSNCPNFSIYSAESQQVAKSADKDNSVNDKEAQKEEDDENEDLVQLDDDDEIPLPPESDGGINGNKSKNIESAELYEPENPTEENDDEENEDEVSDNEENKIKKSDDKENNDEENDDEEKESVKSDHKTDDETERSLKETSESNNKKPISQNDLETQTVNRKKISRDEKVSDNVEKQKSDENSELETDETGNSKKQSKSKSSSPAIPENKLPENETSNRKGVLELYDDTDWEEFDIERPSEAERAQIDIALKKKKAEKAKRSHSQTPTEETENNVVTEDRSYTPCLDENNEPEEAELTPELSLSDNSNTIKNNETIENDVQEKTGARTEADSNLETELISDDEENNRGRKRRSNKVPDHEDREAENAETFKKVSNKQRGRNYRGDKNQQPADRPKHKGRRSTSKSRSKSRSASKPRNRRSRSRSRRRRPFEQRRRSRSRSRSRSYSNNKENSNWRQLGRERGRRPNYRYQRYSGRPKRRELPRYDVRNVVGSQRMVKDRFGRDTSRQMRSRSLSRLRRQRSFTKSRSRSISAARKNRRCSFSMSPTPPPAHRHSLSPRRLHSPRRRSYSPRRVSPMRARSRPPPPRLRSHSMSPEAPHINRRKVTRHVSPMVAQSMSGSPSPRYTPRLSRSFSRSPVAQHPKTNKKKKSRDRKKKKTKKRAKSFSPKPTRRISRQRDPFEADMPPKKKRRRLSKNKSPVAEAGWSPSPSPPPPMIHNYPHEHENNNLSWTPPILASHLEPYPTDLYDTVGRRSGSKESKREKRKRNKKKKRIEKRRDLRKEKRRQHRTITPEPVPSKEVFASGNNILVSVSFNKDHNNQQPQQQTTVVTLPPTREDLIATRRVSIDHMGGMNSQKRKRERVHKRKKTDAKPVAIIDLERSPFQVHQEPADVIVLTDSEDAHDSEHHEHHEHHRLLNESTECIDRHHPPIRSSSRNSMQHDKTPPMERMDTILEESYDLPSTGPKTPPEPPLVKFNLPSKKQNKVRNPLHEDPEITSEAETQERSDLDNSRQELETLHTAANQKVGPNTPPESGPCSPDAYDPFEPTKSPSLSPSSPTPQVMDSQKNLLNDSVDDMARSKLISDDITRISSERVSQPTSSGNITQQTTSMNPVEFVMASLKSNTSQDISSKVNDASFMSSTHIHNTSIGINSVLEANLDGMGREKMDDGSAVSNSITVLSNVLITTGSSQSQHIPVISSPSPMTKTTPSMKMPLSKVSGSVGSSSSGIGLPPLPSFRNNAGGASSNGGGDVFNVNDESPYSPESADYEDLFEPPPDTNNTKKRSHRSNAAGGNAGKTELFDNLFGSSSPIHQLRKSKTGLFNDLRKIKLKGDDVPVSAVDLQMKDKLLRKLNRQERVVEEVKLILKPKFNKKLISKDDYKEIMRRAVPKICHSRSGEINPHKIKNLIEAYVKKFRSKHKKLNIINTGQVSSAVKCAAYLKKL